MSTEFVVEWNGFAANERRKLKTLWSRFQFPPEFCSRFAAQVYKGEPGEGGIFIQAKDLGVFREHWTVELGFSSLEDLARLAADVVLDASKQIVVLQPVRQTSRGGASLRLVS
jgi:hypothetical protein